MPGKSNKFLELSLRSFFSFNHYNPAQLPVDTYLREDVSRVRSILEHLPQMAWISAPDGKINYFTKRWYEYTGQTEEEAMNMGCRRALHPQDDAHAYPAYIQAIQNQKPYEIEKRIRRASDGQYRWHLVRSRPVINPEGGIDLWVGTCTDIHDQKMLAEELEKSVQQRTIALQQAITELERSNGELEQFAFVASHDLQEPLRKIQFFCGSLQAEIKNHRYANVQNLADRVQASANRMSNLLKDLLHYSRLNHHPDQLFTTVSLQEVLNNVLSDLETVIQQKQAVIKAGSLPEIEAIPLLMHQLFLNLISNCLKFTLPHRDPLITITSTCLTEKEKLSHQLTPEKTYFKIEVQDNGIGFDPQWADRIFEIFQRLSNASMIPGTGIGLAICKKIIDKHRALIFAEGEKGKGAKFTMILPEGQV